MTTLLDNLKKSSFFETLSHSKNYLVSNIAVNALAFVSLPVMTRILTPSEYGVLSVFNSYQGIFIAILTLNSYSAVGRYYFEKQTDFKEFFGTSIIFAASLLFVSFSFFMLFRDKIAILLGLPPDTIVFIVPLVATYVLGSWFEQIYIPQRKSRMITIRNVTSAYSLFVLSVICILFLDRNKYLGQLYASLAIGIVFSFYYYYSLRSYIKLSFNPGALKYILSFSLPLLPYALSGVILAQFDRIMINKYSGFSDAGLYSFAYNIGMLLTLVLSALHQAWTPDYFKHMDDKNHAQLDADIAKMLMLVSLAAYFLILFGQEIGMALAKSTFHSSLGIVPIIVIGYLFYSFFTFFAWNIQYAKRNAYLSAVVLISGIVNIVLNAVFIPKYGYVAAAYTTAVSYLLMALLGWFISRYILKLYTAPLRLLLKPLFVLSPFIAAYYVLVFINVPLLLGLFLKTMLFAAFSYVLLKKYFDHIMLHLRTK